MTQKYKILSLVVTIIIPISKFIRHYLIFCLQKGGFFIECGGLDGETRSNTLAFEKNSNWNGIVIEADPKNFAKLKKKHRKAWIIQSCLSIHPYPHSVSEHFVKNIF